MQFRALCESTHRCFKGGFGRSCLIAQNHPCSKQLMDVCDLKAGRAWRAVQSHGQPLCTHRRLSKLQVQPGHSQSAFSYWQVQLVVKLLCVNALTGSWRRYSHLGSVRWREIGSAVFPGNATAFHMRFPALHSSGVKVRIQPNPVKIIPRCSFSLRQSHCWIFYF